MDGASEGQATDGRSGRGFRQKGRRAEQVSTQQPRAVRQNHGMAVVARRQVVTGTLGPARRLRTLRVARESSVESAP